jgi:glycine/D-amino acid oxidase-like deaminating enzyme
MAPGKSSGEWRVGATYNRNDSSSASSEWARTELAGKLEDLIHFPYSIIGQQWGFRPTTPDRKPILGSHPQHPPLIIFNGLGTKGVSLAPYFSEVLFRWMENEGMINKEADVTRFN